MHFIDTATSMHIYHSGQLRQFSHNHNIGSCDRIGEEGDTVCYVGMLSTTIIPASAHGWVHLPFHFVSLYTGWCLGQQKIKCSSLI